MTSDGLLVVETDRFHGPLDLLLHLIRTQDIDIFDIPIARITRQFLEAINALADTSVDEAGEFLEMAAVLVRIKARMLLPAPEGTEDHDPRAELVRRLLEYEMIREVAAPSARGGGRPRAPFREGVCAAAPPPERGRSSAGGHLGGSAGRRAARRGAGGARSGTQGVDAAGGHAGEGRPDRERTVRRARRVEFASLVAPWRERMHGVMTLLAGLELGRRRVVSLRQREHFSPLWFYRGRNLDDRSDDSVFGVAAGPGEGVGGGCCGRRGDGGRRKGGRVNDARIVEAILFASDAPLSPGEIARGDEGLDEDRVEAALAALKAEYDDAGHAFELREVAGGVQLMTRPEFAPYLERFDTVPRSSRLSGPALEALAIVAYRQPIGRIEIEYIRGVNSTGVLRTLLDRELIEGVGRGEGGGAAGPLRHDLEVHGTLRVSRPWNTCRRPEELPVILRERAPLEAAPREPSDEDERRRRGTTSPALDEAEAVAAVLAHADQRPESPE